LQGGQRCQNFGNARPQILDAIGLRAQDDYAKRKRGYLLLARQIRIDCDERINESGEAPEEFAILEA
jgi:hypothetical protein